MQIQSADDSVQVDLNQRVEGLRVRFLQIGCVVTVALDKFDAVACSSFECGLVDADGGETADGEAEQFTC